MLFPLVHRVHQTFATQKPYNQQTKAPQLGLKPLLSLAFGCKDRRSWLHRHHTCGMELSALQGR